MAVEQREDVLTERPVRERRVEPKFGGLRWRQKTLVLVAAVILGVGGGAVASTVLDTGAQLTATEIAERRAAHMSQHFEQLWEAQIQAMYLERAEGMTHRHERNQQLARIQRIHQLRAAEMAAHYARLWEEENSD